MATTAVTPDQDTIVAEIFVAAPPQRVFEAIADPEQRRQWWGQKGLYHTTESSSDLRPGGRWIGAGVSADGKPFRVEGEYLEIDPRAFLSTPGNPVGPTRSTRWSAGSSNRVKSTGCITPARTRSEPALWSASAIPDSLAM